MVTHGCLSTKFLYELSLEYSTNKIIFAGDFNSIPNESCHKFITTGEYDVNLFNKSFPPEDNWRPIHDIIFKSSHYTHHGNEPEYTNYTITSNKKIKDKVHKLCLDYIFYSGTDINVTQSTVIIEGNPPFPSDNEPSDHIMLLSVFKIIC